MNNYETTLSEVCKINMLNVTSEVEFIDSCTKLLCFWMYCRIDELRGRFESFDNFFVKYKPHIEEKNVNMMRCCKNISGMNIFNKTTEKKLIALIIN